MSIQINNYVILGVVIKDEKVSDETYEKYEKHMDSAYKPKRSGFVVIFDGMGGEYVIAGHVLAVTDVDEGYFPGVTTIDPTIGDIKAVEKDLYTNLGIKDPDIKILVVGHMRQHEQNESDAQHDEPRTGTLQARPLHMLGRPPAIPYGRRGLVSAPVRL